MAKGIASQSYEVVVAEDQFHRLICTSKGLKYKPDTMRYVYGKSRRRPQEEWFLDELKYFHDKYPGYEIFTLGSSCVFGEKFINYLTICEFEIDSEASFEALQKALRLSDQAIRKKFQPMWEWAIAGRKDWSIVFVVGHMDFAYFLQHRKEFQGKEHSHYMRSFTTEKTLITSRDYKVLQDGSIVAFDERLLAPADRVVFDNYQNIQYQTIKL